MKTCANCGWIGGNAGCDVCRPAKPRCFKSLVAEMLNGRAWSDLDKSDLDNIEGCIFDRLQDEGHLRTVRVIVVWTPITALSHDALNSRHNAKSPDAGEKGKADE